MSFLGLFRRAPKHPESPCAAVPALRDLADHWLRVARNKHLSAARESEPGKTALIHAAVSLYNCAHDLQRVLDADRLSGDLGLQKVEQGIEGP
jgi:hypothetical protein